MVHAHTYATVEELQQYIGGRYNLSVDSQLLLRDASRFLDRVTLGHAFWEWPNDGVVPDPPSDEQSFIKEAVCAQVEYWLELGEEQSVAPQEGDAQLGQLRVPTPPRLAPKARDALLAAGLMYRGVAAAGWQ